MCSVVDAIKFCITFYKAGPLHAFSMVPCQKLAWGFFDFVINLVLMMVGRLPEGLVDEQR